MNKGMKKMIVALVAMFTMTMSATAQSGNNDAETFSRINRYLELTINQVKPVKQALEQFSVSMEALYQLQDKSKGLEAWQKIKARHMKTMEGILNRTQYENYTIVFEQTERNTAARLMQGAMAAK